MATKPPRTTLADLRGLQAERNQLACPGCGKLTPTLYTRPGDPTPRCAGCTKTER